MGSEASVAGAAAGPAAYTRRFRPRSLSWRALAAGARAEAATNLDRWTLWTPVALGGGCAAYFGLKTEPPLWPLLLCSVLAWTAAIGSQVWGRSRGAVMVAVLLAFGSSGLLAAKLRTLAIASPVLAQAGRVARVEGWVEDVAGRGTSGPRLLVAPVRISGLAAEQVPGRIRVTVTDETVVGPGSAVRFTALLNPPPPPASPGAYDFGRDAFFQRIGGNGVALKPPEVVSLPPPSLGLRLVMAVNTGRWSLSRRIVDEMGPELGGIAAAMTTGHEGWLTATDVQTMRDSGLAHILSISGLHMAVVGGFVFFLVRLLIASWPWAALRVSGKKVAAAAGLAAVLAYLVLSGHPPPAERSAATATIAFGAILLGRRALSLHALAVAAIIVLLLQPEAVAQPGFQMSFAATAALLALAAAWPHREKEISVPWPIALVQRGGAWLWAAVMASFVAGLATEPFAVQHFNRITLYGLPSNLCTEPLSSFVIMPALAIGAVAGALGFGGAPLTVAGWGIDGLLAVGRTFAAAPKAVVIVASAPDWALAVSFLGLLFICLWRGRLRWLGLPLFAAVLILPRPVPPDLWVSADGAQAGVAERGSALVLRPKAQAFAAQVWAHRRGLRLADDPDVSRAAQFDCNRDRCLPKPGAPVAISGWWRRKPPDAVALAELCGSRVAVVVLRTGSDGSPACRGKLVLDAATLAAGGSAEVYRVASTGPPGVQRWRVSWSRSSRGERPWTGRRSGDD